MDWAQQAPRKSSAWTTVGVSVPPNCHGLSWCCRHDSPESTMCSHQRCSSSPVNALRIQSAALTDTNLARGTWGVGALMNNFLNYESSILCWTISGGLICAMSSQLRDSSDDPPCPLSRTQQLKSGRIRQKPSQKGNIYSRVSALLITDCFMNSRQA